jgi:hypothetical protein
MEYVVFSCTQGKIGGGTDILDLICVLNISLLLRDLTYFLNIDILLKGSPDLSFDDNVLIELCPHLYLWNQKTTIQGHPEPSDKCDNNKIR